MVVDASVIVSSVNVVEGGIIVVVGSRAVVVVSSVVGAADVVVVAGSWRVVVDSAAVVVVEDSGGSVTWGAVVSFNGTIESAAGEVVPLSSASVIEAVKAESSINVAVMARIL